MTQNLWLWRSEQSWHNLWIVARFLRLQGSYWKNNRGAIS